MTGDKEFISNAVLRISIRVLINMILIFVLVEGLVTAYHFSYKLFADVPYVAATSNTMEITIPAGSSPGEVAAVLADAGIVDSRYLFLARVYIGEYHKKIQAGSYELGPGMSPDEICKKICGMQNEETS